MEARNVAQIQGLNMNVKENINYTVYFGLFSYAFLFFLENKQPNRC